jgi:ubiquitin-protein ligase
VNIPVAKSVDGYGWIIEATVKGPNPPHPFASSSGAAPYTIQFQIPAKYPQQSPTVKFTKIIYHPNVEQRTLLLDDSFYQRLDWNPSTGKLQHMIALLTSILEHPILVRSPPQQIQKANFGFSLATSA